MLMIYLVGSLLIAAGCLFAVHDFWKREAFAGAFLFLFVAGGSLTAAARVVLVDDATWRSTHTEAMQTPAKP